jgi:hypothetical protein
MKMMLVSTNLTVCEHSGLLNAGFGDSCCKVFPLVSSLEAFWRKLAIWDVSQRWDCAIVANLWFWRPAAFK